MVIMRDAVQSTWKSHYKGDIMKISVFCPDLEIIEGLHWYF